jgi:hypothetical protein
MQENYEKNRLIKLVCQWSWDSGADINNSIYQLIVVHNKSAMQAPLAANQGHLDHMSQGTLSRAAYLHLRKIAQTPWTLQSLHFFKSWECKKITKKIDWLNYYASGLETLVRT